MIVQECQVEDSGTESDDETDKEEAEDNESEDGDMSKSSKTLTLDDILTIHHTIN